MVEKVNIEELLLELMVLEAKVNDLTFRRKTIERTSFLPGIGIRIIPASVLAFIIKQERVAIEDYLCMEQLLSDLSGKTIDVEYEECLDFNKSKWVV
jgi:hypothetical protein